VNVQCILDSAAQMHCPDLPAAQEQGSRVMHCRLEDHGLRVLARSQGRTHAAVCVATDMLLMSSMLARVVNLLQVCPDQDAREAAQINAFFNKTLMMEEVGFVCVGGGEDPGDDLALTCDSVLSHKSSQGDSTRHGLPPTSHSPCLPISRLHLCIMSPPCSTWMAMRWTAT
jgi:hypothetical protein